MKITKVEAIPCSLPRKEGTPDSHVVLVRIHTDEGIVGDAEGGTCAQDMVMAAIKSMEPMLIGADPLNIQSLVTRLMRRAPIQSAVGTVDFALWDIKGKALGVPVYELLGGKEAEKLAIAMMVTRGGPAERAAQAEKVVAAGIKTIVTKVGPNWGTANVAEDVANVRAIRKAVGDDVYLGVDANGGLDYTTALDLAQRLEELNIFKFEQPVARWDIDGMARMRSKVRTPIAAHESCIDIPGLLECIKRDAADSVGIKVVWSGGILKSKEWLAVAKSANLAVFCGSMVGSGYEAAAQAHLLASDAWCAKLAHANLGPVLIHNTFDTTSPQIADDLSLNPPVFKDGYFYAPDGPGLGLELNEKIIPRLISKGKGTLVLEAPRILA